MIKTEAATCQSDGDWLTLQEVSRITGKSVNALNLLISRKKIDRTKKVSGKGQGKWLVHKDSISLISGADRLTGQVQTSDRLEIGQVNGLTDRSEPSVPLEYHDRKLQEWLTERDQLQTGLMMYRYKFEEAETRMRLLPAPPEMVVSRLQEADHKEQVLRDAQEAIIRLEEDLLRERSLPWWKKIFRNR